MESTLLIFLKKGLEGRCDDFQIVFFYCFCFYKQDFARLLGLGRKKHFQKNVVR